MGQDLVFREDVFHDDDIAADPLAGTPRLLMNQGVAPLMVAGIVAGIVAGGMRESVVRPSGLWKRAALLDQMGGWGR